MHFTQSHGEGESHWRGRAPLFSHQSTLYEGYHTHKPGSFSWPFQLEVPRNPDIATLREAKHQWADKEHFLSTEDYIPAHVMPPTFKYRKWGFGYRWCAFVEYVVVATVKEAKGTASVILSTRKATVPLVVRHVASSESVTRSLPLGIEFRVPSPLEEKSRPGASSGQNVLLHTQTVPYTVKSSKLLLWEREPANSLQRMPALSFSNTIREKTKLVFNSSSLPRFTFNLTVSTPDTIHVLDEKGIPFVINAVPVQDDEKTTIPPEQYPDIRIDNVTLIVKALTYIRWKSIMYDRSTDTSSEVKLLDRQPVDQTIVMCQKERNRRSVTETEDDEVSDSPTANENGIDLSKLPALTAVLRAYKTGRQTERPLPPTFHSYIISREYELKWKLELDVAGEKVKIDSDGGRPITVLDPKKEDLEAFAKTSDFLKGKEVEDVENDESEDEAGEADSTNTVTTTTSSNKGTKSMLKRFMSRRKCQEAAEEAAAASSSGQGSGLDYQPGEVLPRYEQGPTDFGYRHEINEQPPRYEQE